MATASGIICKKRRAPSTCGVLFEFKPKQTGLEPDPSFLVVRGRQVPLAVVRSARARRYLFRLNPDGSARLTIPRRGSLVDGRRFAERNTEWLARQLERLPEHPAKPEHWMIGTEIFFRGELVKLEAGIDGHAGTVRFGGEIITIPEGACNFRPWIVKRLWKIAAAEFPIRVFELAAAHQLTVHRVSVRNQRSRWGSCSRRGTISLNWRLIQPPPFVRDYIIFHELMHLRHMDHSARFWREVESVCPEYEAAEKWLKGHSALLR